MSNYRIIVCLVIFTLLLMLLSPNKVQGQNYFEYKVQINRDGTAVWKITQYSSANATVDTFDAFQQKVFDLVDSAANVTHREMTLDENSLQINTIIISPESKTTEYSFVWKNFSIVQNDKISFGDIFQVNNFFGQLYSDAALQLTYPSDFIVTSISPSPNERQDSAFMLKWARTQDLVTNNVSIVLISNSQDANPPTDFWQQYILVIAALVVGVGLFSVGFYAFKRRKSSGTSTILSEESPMLSEAEKILKLLRSSGGTMRQSKITEQCRFSKAKTSQLLGVLEKQGSITRYKNGRDKIVTLKERVKGE